jgi:hypothetical protein
LLTGETGLALPAGAALAPVDGSGAPTATSQRWPGAPCAGLRATVAGWLVAGTLAESVVKEGWAVAAGAGVNWVAVSFLLIPLLHDTKAAAAMAKAEKVLFFIGTKLVYKSR